MNVLIKAALKRLNPLAKTNLTVDSDPEAIKKMAKKVGAMKEKSFPRHDVSYDHAQALSKFLKASA